MFVVILCPKMATNLCESGRPAFLMVQLVRFLGGREGGGVKNFSVVKISKQKKKRERRWWEIVWAEGREKKILC